MATKVVMTDMTELSMPFDPAAWLRTALAKISGARVAVIGDFCVDAYWHLEVGGSPQISIETGLPVRSVRRQSYGLGGAGNVVANLIDLGVGQVRAIGIYGDDVWGPELMRLLRERGADVSGMVAGGKEWQTAVYAKPYRGDVEESRIDFGGFNQLSPAQGDALVEALGAAAKKCDVVVINQQFRSGQGAAGLVEKFNRVIADHPHKRFIVDSRDAAALFRGVAMKLNAVEAGKLAGDSAGDVATLRRTAVKLSQRFGQPVFITRGDRGIIVAEGSDVTDIPGIQIIDPTDPVGAGDTVVAAVAAALGSGCDAESAARLANIAASVTVRKLRTTGTATPAEILAGGAEPDYVYAPELADDPRAARFAEGAEIEIVRVLPDDIDIKHAIFDHDGTLSTLREGWEKIMEPMMVGAVMGTRINDAPAKTLASVTKTVREFIDKTTGIQTLTQMAGLVGLVRRSGFVPEDDILDEHGYKAIFNRKLIEMVQERITKLHRGELDPADFAIKNAHALLRRLHDRGVKLYLASGTDIADVAAEARAMGYADLFEGRIYGAVGKVDVEAKKMVIDRMIREHRLAGHEFVTFGDGPVEMRETHRRGGICVGICSDEMRRFGFNMNKRARLIRGGAGLLVGDYSQLDQLLALLKLN